MAVPEELDELDKAISALQSKISKCRKDLDQGHKDVKTVQSALNDKKETLADTVEEFRALVTASVVDIHEYEEMLMEVIVAEELVSEQKVKVAKTISVLEATRSRLAAAVDLADSLRAKRAKWGTVLLFSRET